MWRIPWWQIFQMLTTAVINTLNSFSILYRFKMGMPDLSDKENNPNLPQGSALNQLEVPKNRNNDNRNCVGGSVRSVVEIKKEILRTTDMDVRRQLFELVRFRTSRQQMSSLREYVQRMVEGQTDIYYMVGRSAQQLARSPFVRRVIEAGLEVIYMIDPILDEQVVKKLERQYDRFRLVSVNSEQLELPDLNNQLERKKRQREAIEEFLPLCKRLKFVYPEQIQKIVISNTVPYLFYILSYSRVLSTSCYFSWSRVLAQ